MKTWRLWLKPSDVPLIETKPKINKKTLLLIVVLLSVCTLIFFSSFGLVNQETKPLNYADEVELKLENLLSKIKGVGKVNVMVSVDGTVEEVLAKNVETKIENGVKSTIETVIIVSGKPYVIKTLQPKITSVTVVCKGANNIAVKLAIVECITNAYSVNADCIKIFKLK